MRYAPVSVIAAIASLTPIQVGSAVGSEVKKITMRTIEATNPLYREMEVSFTIIPGGVHNVEVAGLTCYQ